MSSLKKQIASRLNGAQSRGPNTPEGKRNSSRNALKHGLSGENLFILQHEAPEKWEALLELCRRVFQPRNDFESELVTEIAAARWRMLRLWGAETALLNREMDQQRPRLDGECPQVDPNTRLACAIRALSDDSRSFAAVTRHESRIRRNYEHALRELAAFRSGHLPTSRRAAELAPLAAHPEFQNEPTISLETKDRGLKTNLPEHPTHPKVDGEARIG